MTSILLLKGIGKKKGDEFSKLNINTVEELSVAKGLPKLLEKYKQVAIDFLQNKVSTPVQVHQMQNQVPQVQNHQVQNQVQEERCTSIIFDKHTWLNKTVQIPSGKNNAIHKAIIQEILLEHGERLVVLCKDSLTKKTSSWQIPTLTVLNFELPPLRLTMSQEDMDSIPCLEYVLSTLWQSDYLRSCQEPE
jgi:hypothetical protein